jgi:hypothetical protein
MAAKTAKTHTFRSKLVRPEGTGTWTYVEVPPTVSEAFGARGRVAIAGTISGVPFQGSLMPAGEGRHRVVVAKAIRDAAKVTAGDTVTVAIHADSSTRTVEVPPELAAALKKDRAARDAFEGLSYSHRKEYASWVGEAKKPETRVARAAKAIAMLAEGKRLKE